MWDQIKQILKKNKGTCIIIEEGQPVYVITSFDDYQKNLEGEPLAKTVAPRLRETPGSLRSRPLRLGGEASEGEESETELLEKINQEIIDWKVKQAENSSEVQLADIQDSDELRIENLPLI